MRGRSVRKQSVKVGDLFYCIASILMVATLIHGLPKASDPASTPGSTSARPPRVFGQYLTSQCTATGAAATVASIVPNPTHVLT